MTYLNQYNYLRNEPKAILICVSLSQAELEARLADASLAASTGAAAQRRSSAAEGMAAELADQMRQQAEDLAELQVQRV